MVDIKTLVRENVLNLIPYSCARDEFKGKNGVFMDANENPYGKLNRYPDPYQKDLKAAISDYKGIPEENIFLGNGSDEIIDLCFRVFCKPGIDKVLIFTPTYGMYEVSAAVNDITVIRISLNEKFQIDLTSTRKLLTDKNIKLIFVCSPNNPTGNTMNYSDVEFIIRSFNGIVVIDEAYIDFSDKPSFLNLIKKYPNLIVMQTFSKAFGLAAVRVGMAFMNKVVIQYFNKLKPPYNISTINQNAVLRRLAGTTQIVKQVASIRKERERVIAALQKMKITEEIYPTDANFVLIKVKDSAMVYNRLVSENIIIRNRHSLVKNCLRITIGKKSENNSLLKALNTIRI